MKPEATHHGDGLPPEIESLISRVVKRARLRKSERRDVEAELRTHFGAGLAEGKTAQELVVEFGDARAAGRMIGRAKRRCRGIVWHAWVWSCRGVMALFALVLVTYAWAAWCYYGTEPTITRNYMKEMNAKIEAIPESDRAWPVYREALLSLTRADADRLYDFGYDFKEGAPEWSELEDIVARNRGAIELAFRGSTRPALGAPVSSEYDEDLRAWWGSKQQDSSAAPADPENPPLRTLDGRPGTSLRMLAYLLRSDARVALAENDGARWARDIVAIMRMAAQVGGSSQMLSYLIAISLDQTARGWVGEAIALHPDRISDEDLVGIAHELASSLAWKREIPFEDEKRSSEDSIQRLYNIKTGRITAEGVEELAEYYRSIVPLDENSKRIMEPPTLLGPVNAMVMATRDEALARVHWMFDSWARRAHTPLLERGKDEVRTWVAEEPLLDIFDSRWWPVFAGNVIAFGTEEFMDRMVQETEGLQVAIAIELFRRHTGRLPTTLDELVPRYVPEVPIDIFSGKGLRYIVSNGIPIVYSIGCDMDDDGGREPEESIGRWAVSIAADGQPRATDPEWWTEDNIRKYDGDWPLWPRFDRDTREFVYRKSDASAVAPAN